MSASVNLVPQACLVARQRALRRNRWCVVAVALAAVLACGGFLRFSASAAVDAAQQHLVNLQARQADLDRRLAVLLRSRAEMYQRARTLASLRQNPLLPEQLVALAAETPSGVLLVDLRADAPAPLPDAARTRPPPPPPAAPGRAAPPASQPAVPMERTVRLSGYALDHERLKEFIEAARRVPDWRRVELVRASRETYAGGPAIAFQLECQERSDPR